jgi:NADH-quinone oxidoreductase subunit N
VLWVCALLTMVIGNFAALMQNNLKRLLAYSSIAHAGYVLVAITAHNDVGVQAVMFLKIEDMAGLGFRRPGLAAFLTIFLLSLIGVPLTAGFFGKFYVFKAALDGGLVWLTVLGLLNSAVAAYYYLRIIVVMYMYEPAESVEGVQPLSIGTSATLWVSALATIILGIFPGLILDFAGRSAELVR